MTTRGSRPVEPTTARTRRTDERFGGIQRFELELPSVSAALRYVGAVVSHTFSASYTLGGEDPSPAFPATPTFVDAIIAPAGGYTFRYSGGKFIAYKTFATEAVVATNLSTLGALPVLLLCERAPEHVIAEALEGLTLTGTRLSVQGDVARDDTDYWTIRLQVVRAYGLIEDVGTLSTADLSLTAGVQYPVDAPEGRAEVTRLAPGDILRVRFEDSGRAPSLVAPLLTVTARRT